MSLSGHGPTAAVNDVNDHLCETKTSSKSASSGGGGKCLSFQHERVVIQDRGFGRRRSPPRGGCDRVGAPQAAPCRPASAGAGDDELRWNADHHAGHALPATPRARSGAGNGADRGAGTQGRRAPPAHHARQRRSLRPLGSTHAIAVGLSQPSGSVYTPPAIANPSERIKDLNSSFPLNGGLGLNPSNRDDYIRYNLNR